ncbi:MAG: putative membrane protein [uncultured Caballeronia sp.]|nr:MAG: putative membrane protein [uncultured Caballeronia sp.]
MTSFAIARFAAITLTFLIAGTVKGVKGMGLPTVAMGVLGSSCCRPKRLPC